MAKRKLEDEIADVSALRDAPPAEASAGLQKALASRINLTIAQAAKVTAELQLRDLIPHLIAAYDRLFENGVERDKQCWAKNAITKALTALDYREHAPFLRGARYNQMEPGFGRAVDTAITLRGICLLGLAACNDLTRAEILRHLVDAMADKEHVVRVEAIRAIAEMDGDEAILLVRLKARLGDEEAPVVGQAFDSVLHLEGRRGLPFVAEFLDSANEEVQCEAALALGGCRLSEALDPLLASLANARGRDLRETIYRALSTSRQPRAIEFLLTTVKTGLSADGAGAVEALALHQESDEIRAAVEEAVKDASHEVQVQYRRAFQR